MNRNAVPAIAVLVLLGGLWGYYLERSWDEKHPKKKDTEVQEGKPSAKDPDESSDTPDNRVATLSTIQQNLLNDEPLTGLGDSDVEPKYYGKVTTIIHEALSLTNNSKFAEAQSTLDRGINEYGKFEFEGEDTPYGTYADYLNETKKLVSCYERRGFLKGFTTQSKYFEQIKAAFLSSQVDEFIGLLPCDLFNADDGAPTFSRTTEVEKSGRETFMRFVDPMTKKVFSFKSFDRGEGAYQLDFHNGLSLQLHVSNHAMTDRAAREPSVILYSGPKEWVDEVGD